MIQYIQIQHQKAVLWMNTARKILLKLIEQIPDSQIPEIIDFIGYLKIKKENEIFKDLELPVKTV